MNELKKLVDRCNEMDITEQINWLGDATMPYQAAKEFAAMQEAVEIMSDFLEDAKQLDKQEYKDMAWKWFKSYAVHFGKIAAKLDGLK